MIADSNQKKWQKWEDDGLFVGKSSYAIREIYTQWTMAYMYRAIPRSSFDTWKDAKENWEKISEAHEKAREAGAPDEVLADIKTCHEYLSEDFMNHYYYD